MKALTITIAAAFALLLTGCSVSTPPEVVDAGQKSAPAADVAEAEPLTDEEQAHLAATAMDPAFSDPDTWYAALEVAQSYCDMATITDPDTALGLMVVQAQQYDNITEEQVGIMAGIGQHLYCPEIAG